jgi:hypothetical protein
MQRILLIVILLAFSALTVLALIHHGVTGIFSHQFVNLAGMQVFLDLVIALALFLVWMWRDARAAGRNPWPWLLLTLVVGSIGPLIYLILYPQKPLTGGGPGNAR